VAAAHLPIVRGKVAAWLDGELRLHVERSGAGLASTLTLVRGTAHLGPIAAERSLQDVGPLADVTYVDAPPGDGGMALTLQRLGTAMAVTATIPGPFHVESPDLRVDLQGALHLGAGAGPLRVRGAVTGRPGGWIDLYGRRFQIATLQLTFSEGVPAPTLAVRLKRERPEATLIIDLAGPLDHPKLTLSSEPPIYDPAQLAALVVSGDPSAIRGDSSQAAQMTAALSAALVGQLKSELLPQLPVDTFKLEGARLEAGKLLGERVYVAYVHQTVAPGDVRHMNSNQAQLELRLPHGWTIETLYGDGSVGALDVSWKRRRY
jgi:autotransporter translocation and assembly factor TamB